MPPEDLLPILRSLHDEVTGVWLAVFESPPVFDPTDWLDGEALEYLLGRDFREFGRFSSTPLADSPFHSLLPLEAAGYYIGSSLLDLLLTWDAFIRRPPLSDGFVPPILYASPHFSMLGHLGTDTAQEWFSHRPACQRTIGKVFNFIVGPVADTFPDEFMGDELEECGKIARDYARQV